MLEICNNEIKNDAYRSNLSQLGVGVNDDLLLRDRLDTNGIQGLAPAELET
jgi:hypothetical protein